MANIINERDKNITEALVRVLPVGGDYIYLSSSAQYFKVGNDSVATPQEIVIKANLVGNLSGTCVFSVVNAGAATLVSSGNTTTLTFANMFSDTVTVRASLEKLNNTYTADITITKLENGTIGTSGDSVDIIFIRNSTIPSTPPNTTVTPAGWYSTTDSVPADTSMPLWSSVGTKAAGQEYYIWQKPISVEGSTIAEISIFKRSSISLDTPTGGVYNFNNTTLTPPLGWSTSIAPGTDPMYISRAVAAIYGSLGEDTSLTWSAPSISFQSTAVLTLLSDADVIPSDDSGKGYLLPTGNSLRLYVGNTLEQTNVVFGGTATKGGLTLTVNASTGAVVLSGNLWNTTQESFVLTASYAGVVYQILYTISKAVAGATTIIPDLVSGTDAIYANSDGTGYSLPSGNSMKLYKGAQTITTGVVYAGTTTKNGLTATINATTGIITLSGAAWTSTGETFTFTATYNSVIYSATYSLSKALAGIPGGPGTPGLAGESNILADLSSETGLVTTDSDGILTGTLPTGVKVSLYSGTTKIITGITYSIVVGSGPVGIDSGSSVYRIQSGLRLSILKTTGDITLTEETSQWNSDNVTFTINLTYNNKTYTVNYTISKLRQGSPSIITNLTGGENVLVVTNSKGTGVALPSDTNYFELFKGNIKITNGLTYSFQSPSTVSTIYASTYYRTQNGLNLFLNTSTGSYFFTLQTSTSWTTDSETFKIIAKYNNVDYIKSVTLTKIKTADSSVSVMLVSEADVVSTNSSGSGYILPSGNYLKLFVGADWLTSGLNYSGSATKNGLTLNINSAGAITLEGSSWTSNQESFTLTATISATNTSYTKIYTITKSIAGSDVVLMDLVTESNLVSTATDGTGYAYPTGNQALLYKGGTLISANIAYGISGGTVGASSTTKTQNGLTLTVNNSTGAISLSGSAWNSNQESFTLTTTFSSNLYYRSYSITKAKAGTNGASATFADLVSESDVVFASSEGTNYTYPLGNALRLYLGGQQQTVGVTYSGTTSKSGLTATIGITGDITLTGASWTSNQEAFTFTATYNGIAYTAEYTIAKAKQGASAVFIDLLSESEVTTANNAGTEYTLPSGNAIRLYKGTALLVSGVSYAGSVNNRNGLNISVNSTTGEISLSNVLNGTWTTDKEIFDLTATYDSITYSARYSITKARRGADGLSITGNSARICYTKTILTSLATTPDTYTSTGNATFPSNDSWGTGTVWQGTPPIITAGQSLYQSNGIYNAVTNVTTWTVPYLSNLKVGSLSAISADLGTITAGSITGASLRIGSAPAVSGTTMSGQGLQINTDGTFAMGNNSTNLSFNGERLTLNGDIVTSANIQQGAVTYINNAFAQTSLYFSTTTTQVEYSVLDINLYCDGSQITIIGDVEQQFGTIYKIGSNSYGRGWSFRLAWKPYFDTVYSTISFQTSNAAVFKFGYMSTIPAGYNTFSLLVKEDAVPATGTIFTRGLHGLRHMNIVQTKR